MVQLTRRAFAKVAMSALAMPTIIPGRALGKDGAIAPSNRITVATIGLGDRGNQHIGSYIGMPEVELLAVCDIHKPSIKKQLDRLATSQSNTSCKGYQDFRDVLARKDIDAITITSPENWHALMSILAMRSGKDVYCEKALSLTVAEGRAICNTVKQTGRILQAGTQQRSDPRFRQACELARNGYLGKLTEVYVSAPSGKRLLKFPTAEIPVDVDYDLFLGPAPYKPYRQNIYKFNWYFLTDYCAGWIQSWGVHHLDIALWGAPALGQGTLAISGKVGFLPEGDADVTFSWDINATDAKGLALHYCSDGTHPYGHGVRFIGDKGWVHVTRGDIKVSDPKLLGIVMKPADIHLPVSNNHMMDFFNGIKNRSQPIAPAEACHAATTLSLLADIAGRSEQKLIWDWKQERFTNNELANRSLTRPMRKGWTI
jgi:predicted dehydrogenase